MPWVPLLIVLILLLVLVEGFFSGSETAFTSASRTYLQQQAATGEPRAALALKMLARTERFLGTTLMGTNLAVVSSTTLAQSLLSRLPLGDWTSVANTLIMTPLILIVGELLPKSIGRAHSEALCVRLARPLLWAQNVLLPFVVLTSKLARFIAELVVGTPAPSLNPFVTREDLRAMAQLAVEQGIVTETSGTMLCTLFGLRGEPISAIMVPLVDVALVPLEATAGDIEKLAVRTGFSRFPVYQGRVDEIVGVVDLRELLCAGTGGTDATDFVTLDTPIRPWVQTNIVFAPETKPVSSLLHELRYQRVPMAIVVDEHGGVVGIVTTEDLVEEVVGEIHDERDQLRTKPRHISASVFECDGRLEIRDLIEQFGIEIERDGFETVAGFVLKLAGRIPQVGERFRFGHYDIEVLEIARRRIARLRFCRRASQDL